MSRWSAFRRAAALTLCMILMLCSSMTAYADVEATTAGAADVYVLNNGQPVRAGTLAGGTRVTVKAVKNGWALVEKGGKQGYIKKSDLTVEDQTQTTEPASAPATISAVTKCNKTIYVAVDGAKVYSTASTSGSVLVKPDLGTALNMRAYNDEWCMVKGGGKTGYIRRSDISLSRAETVDPDDVRQTDSTTATDITTCDKTGYAVQDGVKVYAKASDGSKVLTTLSKNDTIRVVAYNFDWCMVKKGGKTGYVKKGELSDEAISDLPSELKYGESGDYVKAMQQKLKELGYFDGSVEGNYLDQTKKAVALFQSQNDLTIDGNADSATLKKLFSGSANKYDSSKVVEAETTPVATGSSTAKPASGKSQEMDWWTSDIQKIFARGVTAVVTDVDTGISWRERRYGGTNHADCQPVTAADTAAMLKACGSWSWTRRAIWVSIDGQKYAASMNCMPHGSGSIQDNNFNGHHCIHFTNSRTHGTNRVCPLHQAAIKKAASKG